MGKKGAGKPKQNKGIDPHINDVSSASDSDASPESNSDDEKVPVTPSHRGRALVARTASALRSQRSHGTKRSPAAKSTPQSQQSRGRSRTPRTRTTKTPKNKNLDPDPHAQNSGATNTIHVTVKYLGLHHLISLMRYSAGTKEYRRQNLKPQTNH